MTLRLYDTHAQASRAFVPVQPGRAGIYVCGLTVQSPPHVGHIRSGVNFDVLWRWLAYAGYAVTYIRNVTDIDDKVLAKSAELGVPWWAHAYANERMLKEAYDVVGCLPATYEPRATGHIPEMVELIERLLDAGHAYPASDDSGDVYFDVGSWPSYGELSRQRIEDMEPAQDADPRGKREPRDFALWKGRKSAEPATAAWPAPWGAGRPGWHLECSAMASKYLGREFDIHGGGIDLRFPHHENELAQSRAVGEPFARFWLHNAWITTSGEKMSKSLGNSLLVSAVVERVRPIELRYYLVWPHYRSHVEFSFDALEEAAAAFRRIEGYVERATEVTAGLPRQATSPPLCAEFVAAMNDDLATPGAIAAIHDAVREGNKLLVDGDSAALRGNLASVRGMLAVLGLDPLDEPWAAAQSRAGERFEQATERLAADLLEQRQQARARRDFAAADAIRDQLRSAGIEIEDTPQGPRWTLGG